MSDLNRSELIAQVGELVERVSADEQDLSAINELDQLVAHNEAAKEIYLQHIWMQVQMRSSAVLSNEIDDRIPAAALAVGLPTEDEELQLWSVWSIGTAVAAALCMTILIAWPLGRLHDSTPIAVADTIESSSSFYAGSKQAVANSNSGETLPEKRVLNNALASNNLAHPGNSMRLVGGVADSDDLAIPETISFNQHVRSILSENCYYCHGPDPNHRKADLRLDTAEGAEYVIDLDNPEDSELMLRIHSEDAEDLMPPPESGRVVSDYEKQILKKWIAQGANYEPHWAFIAPRKTALPETDDRGWGRNEVDRFILARLEKEGIKPSPRAEPSVLVRRLYLDLIGLPPSVEQVESFLASYQGDADMAIEGLVDQLLASAHYGERMSLPWLDSARYSDSNGFQQDGDRHQWPWRDWVVKAMNDNMPFDQFTIEQLAGDLLESPTEDQLIATAFNRNHMINGEGGAIAEEQRNNYVFDRVDTTATTWLGMTMACAQCHDHKYDPIAQKDYYRFFAYFNNIEENGGVNFRAGRLQCGTPLLKLPTDEQTAKIEEVDKKIKPIRESLDAENDKIIEAMKEWEVVALKDPPEKLNRDLFRILKLPFDERNNGEINKLKDYFLLNFAADDWKEPRKELKGFEDQRKKIQSQITTVMVMRERKKKRATNLFHRGEYDQKGERVFPGVPAFLPKLGVDKHKDRLTLARWLVDPGNPLTSRVTVNRYWQTFFGTGLVKTSEDFGVQGELPSHPELLDWLAVDFVEHGWDVKRIHRMLVTSEAYLQSARHREDLIEIDPENRLIARSPRFRLPSMLIRDAALSVSGLLNDSIGGKPVYPYQPVGLWKEFSLERFSYKPSTGEDLYRRSLYTFWRRTVAPPNLFDAANRQTCIVKSSLTNTPLHALVMLNDPTFVEASRALAQKVVQKDAGNDQENLKKGFSIAIGRHPTKKEMSSLTSALEDSRTHFSKHHEDARQLLTVGDTGKVPEDNDEMVELAALTCVMQVVMNTDEFMTRE